ncbi:hypothetical protein FRB94_006089 [Tulasnella sp. JGI-2019a]|nr:hypothetical protein FRB93_013242 [Tulasnella sp. JGI-2019a]KAG8999577.1 hypothetical protein FRB94_006089 [Tulasnella sp. JGI-2019a]KAG9024019.1 hypothetical protein FRB95_012204 [Tulasnella sp. JGI-2019a]
MKGFYTGHHSYMDVSLGTLPLYPGWQGGRGQLIQNVMNVNSFTDLMGSCATVVNGEFDAPNSE